MSGMTLIRTPFIRGWSKNTFDTLKNVVIPEGGSTQNSYTIPFHGPTTL